MLNWLAWLFLTGLSIFSAVHALLNKRDPRAALGWIVVCLSLPGIGVLFYWLLGVNRIRSRARDWQQQGPGRYWSEANTCAWASHTFEIDPFRSENYASLRSLSDSVTRRPLLQGNRVEPLYNGEQVFPAMQVDLKPIEKIKASDQVAEKLLKHILQGGIAPGEKLPPERELAALFNVTRTTLREALKRLEQLKLIAIRQGQGIMVEDYRTASIDVLLYLLTLDGAIDLSILESILEARDLFGREVARLAARRADQSDLDQMARLMEKMAGTKEPTELQLLDFELFRLLALAGKNIVYTLLMNMLKTLHEKHVHLFAPLSSQMDISLQRAIVEAVRSGNEAEAGEKAGRFLSVGIELLKTLKTM